MAATTLNTFHRHTERVKMANIAQTVNVLQAMLLTDGAKMAKTPTYHVFAMYLPFQDAVPLPVELNASKLLSGKDSFPAFNVSAARAKEGRVHIAVANLDANKPQSIRPTLGGIAAKGVRGSLLTHARIDAHSVPGAREDIAPVPFKAGRISGQILTLEVPAKSIIVVKLA